MWAWKVLDVWDTAVAADDAAVSPPLADLERVARARLAAAVAGLLGPDLGDVDLALRRGPDAAGLLLHATADADVLPADDRAPVTVTHAVGPERSSRA